MFGVHKSPVAEIFNYALLGTRMPSLSETIGRRLNRLPTYEEPRYYCYNSLPISGPLLDRQIISNIYIRATWTWFFLPVIITGCDCVSFHFVFTFSGVAFRLFWVFLWPDSRTSWLGMLEPSRWILCLRDFTGPLPGFFWLCLPLCISPSLWEIGFGINGYLYRDQQVLREGGNVLFCTSTHARTHTQPLSLACWQGGHLSSGWDNSASRRQKSVILPLASSSLICPIVS